MTGRCVPTGLDLLGCWFTAASVICTHICNCNISTCLTMHNQKMYKNQILDQPLLGPLTVSRGVHARLDDSSKRALEV